MIKKIRMKIKTMGDVSCWTETFDPNVYWIKSNLVEFEKRPATELAYQYIRDFNNSLQLNEFPRIVISAEFIED